MWGEEEGDGRERRGRERPGREGRGQEEGEGEEEERKNVPLSLNILLFISYEQSPYKKMIH